MSKPWSEAGLADEWAALARHYVIGAVIVALMLFIAGMSCERTLAHRGTSTLIAADGAKAAAYRDSLQEERTLNDTLVGRYLALHAQVATLSQLAEAANRTAARATNGIRVDTVVLAAREQGSRSAASAAIDTVAYVAVFHAADTVAHPAPKFFVDGYLAVQALAASEHARAESEHQLRLVGDMRFVDDSTHRFYEEIYADSVIRAQDRQIAALVHQGHPWCGWRCGSLGTLGVLAAVAYVVRTVK